MDTKFYYTEIHIISPRFFFFLHISQMLNVFTFGYTVDIYDNLFHLTRVSAYHDRQETHIRVDVCRITKGEHIEHLWNMLKKTLVRLFVFQCNNIWYPSRSSFVANFWMFHGLMNNYWAISPVNDKYCSPVSYCSLSKTSLRVRRQVRTFSISLCHHQEITRSCFQYTMKSAITIPKISFNTRDISSVRLPTQGMTYPRRCFGQRFASSFRTWDI
jgi:hypothetical protein